MRLLFILSFLIIINISVLVSPVNSHITEQKVAEEIELEYNYNLLQSDQRSIELNSHSKTVVLLELQNHPIFSPLVISVTLFNDSDGFNSTQGPNSFGNRKIEVVLDFLGMKDENKEIYPVKTIKIEDEGIIGNTYTKIIDISTLVGNLREWPFKVGEIEDYSERDNGVPIKVSLKISDTSWTLTKINKNILFFYEIFSYYITGISEESFHNDLQLKTPVVKQYYFWGDTLNKKSEEVFILIPISITDLVLPNTVNAHLELGNDPPKPIEMELRLNVSMKHEFPEENNTDFQLEIDYGFYNFRKEKTGKNSFEYVLKIESIRDQFIELIMTNNGYDIDLYLHSVEIIIPAIFYKPSQTEKLIILFYTYKLAFIILGGVILLSVPQVIRDTNEQYQRRLPNWNKSKEVKVYNKIKNRKLWQPGKTIGRRIKGRSPWGSPTNPNSAEKEGMFDKTGNKSKDHLDKPLGEREKSVDNAFNKLMQIKQNGIKNKNDFRYFNTRDTLPHTLNSRIQNQSKINQFPRMRLLPSSSFYDKKKDHSIQLPKTKYGNISEIVGDRPSRQETRINHQPQSKMPKLSFPRSKPKYTPNPPMDSYKRSEYSWAPNRKNYSRSTSFGFGSSQRQYVRRSSIGRISSEKQRKIQRLRNQKEIENYKNTSQGFWSKVNQSLLKIIFGTLLSLSKRKSKRNSTNKNGTNNSQNSSNPNSNHNEEDLLTKIIEYLKEGKSIAWIARLFGLDRNYLYNLAIRLQQNRIIYHCKGIREEKKNRRDMGIEPKESRQKPKQDTKKVYSKSYKDFVLDSTSQFLHMGPKSIHNSQQNDLRTLNAILKMFELIEKREPTRGEYKSIRKIDLRNKESWQEIKPFKLNYYSSKEFLKDLAYHFSHDLFNDVSLLFPNLHLDRETERQFHRYIGKMKDGKFKPGALAWNIVRHPGGNWDLEVGRVNTPLIFLGEIEALIRTAKMLVDLIKNEYDVSYKQAVNALMVAWQKGPSGERALEKDFSENADENSASGPDGLIVVDVKKIMGKDFDSELFAKYEFVFVEGKTQSTYHKTRQLVYIKKSPGNKAYVGSDLLLKVSSAAPLFDAIFNMYYQDSKSQNEFYAVLGDYYERIKEDVNLAKLEFLSDKVKKPSNQLFMEHDGHRWKNITLEEVNRNRLHDLNFSLSLRKTDDTLTDSDYHQLSYEFVQLFGSKTVDDEIQDLIKKEFSEEKIELNQININFTLFPDSILKRREGTTKFLMITGDISDERLAELSLKGHCIAFRKKDGDIISQFSKLVQFEFQPNARHFSKSFSVPTHYKHGPKDYLTIHRGYHQSVPWSDFVNFVFKGRSKLKSVWFPSTVVGGMTYRNELPLRSSSGSLSTSTGAIVSGELTSLDMTASYVGKYLDKPTKPVPTPRIRMDVRHPCEFEERGEMRCKEAIEKGASPDAVILPPSKKTGRRSSTFIDNLIDDSLWNQLDHGQKNNDLSQFKGYFQKTRSSVLRAYNNAKNISDGGQNDGKSGIAKWWCHGCGVKRVDGLIHQFAANMKNRGVSDEFLDMWKTQYFSEYI